MVSRVRGRTRCRRASGWAFSPLAAAAADLVSASRPSSRAMACRVAADRASGCSNGTAAASCLGADDLSGAGHGPVRADHDGQRGQQFGEVEVLLPLGGGQLGEAEVGQPWPPVVPGHHVGRPQGPVGDPGAVQPVHVGPQPAEEVVADPLRGELAERAALYLVHDQQRGPAAGLDHPVDAGDARRRPVRPSRR